MASARSNAALTGQLGTLYALGAAGSMTDSLLLERFVAREDPEESDAAFAALVERHGPMVLGVCRQGLPGFHDAHDAFQATFLVLVRRARSIQGRGSLAGWLFGTARRVAARARVEAARRRRHLEKLQHDHPAVRESTEPPLPCDLELDFRPLVQEIDALPERFRSPVVLHYLEGLSTEATALRLGCPRGTVLSRFARARRRLRCAAGAPGRFARRLAAGARRGQSIPARFNRASRVDPGDGPRRQLLGLGRRGHRKRRFRRGPDLVEARLPRGLMLAQVRVASLLIGLLAAVRRRRVRDDRPGTRKVATPRSLSCEGHEPGGTCSNSSDREGCPERRKRAGRHPWSGRRPWWRTDRRRPGRPQPAAGPLLEHPFMRAGGQERAGWSFPGERPA